MTFVSFILFCNVSSGETTSRNTIFDIQHMVTGPTYPQPNSLFCFVFFFLHLCSYQPRNAYAELVYFLFLCSDHLFFVLLLCFVFYLYGLPPAEADPSVEFTPPALHVCLLFGVVAIMVFLLQNPCTIS